MNSKPWDVEIVKLALHNNPKASRLIFSQNISPYPSPVPWIRPWLSQARTDEHAALLKFSQLGIKESRTNRLLLKITFKKRKPSYKQEYFRHVCFSSWDIGFLANVSVCVCEQCWDAQSKFCEGLLDPFVELFMRNKGKKQTNTNCDTLTVLLFRWGIGEIWLAFVLYEQVYK